MAGIFILLPVTVQELPVVYSIWCMISVTSVWEVVSDVMVPLVKFGTTGAARAGVDNPSKHSVARICFI